MNEVSSQGIQCSWRWNERARAKAATMKAREQWELKSVTKERNKEEEKKSSPSGIMIQSKMVVASQNNRLLLLAKPGKAVPDPLPHGDGVVAEVDGVSEPGQLEFEEALR